MTYKSPTNLNTSRNRALQIGTVPAGFAEPEMIGMTPPAYSDDAADPARGNTAPPVAPSPFKIKGA